MTEIIILNVVWETLALIVYLAIIDEDTKPLKKFGYILFSWVFAFFLAPIEIARAINKINNSKTQENESRQRNKVN